MDSPDQTIMNKSDLKKLKQLTHHLDPVVLLGAKGLTDAVHAEIECALEAHELIKIKLNSKDKAEKELLAQAICKKHHAILANQIGHVIAIYREKEKTQTEHYETHQAQKRR
jgi:RNA-binding protein